MGEQIHNALTARMSDPREYDCIHHGRPIRLRWSDMTHVQRERQLSLEIEAARRVAYVDDFNPCGLN